jgi:fructokinase
MSDPQLVIGAGELLWDCFSDDRRPGGAPANVAYHCRQLGLSAAVYSRVGSDAEGQELIDYLASRGLATDCVQQDPRHATGRVTVDVSAHDHPVYTIHEDVAWDHLELDDSISRLAGEAAAICFGTLAQRSDRSREALLGLLEHTSEECLIIYDVNLRPPWYRAEVIGESLRAANIVKLNQQEALELASLMEMKVSELDDVARVIQSEYDVELVCVTRGAEGCLLMGRNGSAEDPVNAVSTGDVVGAGDAFTAGLIYARLRRWSLQVQATFANEIGALVAGQAGAMPEMQSEFSDAIARFQG